MGLAIATEFAFNRLLDWARNDPDPLPFQYHPPDRDSKPLFEEVDEMIPSRFHRHPLRHVPSFPDLDSEPDTHHIDHYVPKDGKGSGFAVFQTGTGQWTTTTLEEWNARLPQDFHPHGGVLGESAMIAIAEQLIPQVLSAEKKDKTESLESQLLEKFPDLEEQVLRALASLPGEVAYVKAFPGSRNDVYTISLGNKLPFIFKMYANESMAKREALMLKVLSLHPQLAHHTPTVIASGQYGDVFCNAIENVNTRSRETNFADRMHRTKVYGLAENILRQQGMPLFVLDTPENQLLYTLAVLHSSKDFFNSHFGNVVPINPEQVEEGLIKAGDLPSDFVGKSVSAYRRLLEEQEASYENAFIHGDPVSRNVVIPKSSSRILTGGNRVYLVDWETAGLGMVETDLARALMEDIAYGNPINAKIATYVAFRGALTGEEKWSDKGEYQRLFRSVAKFGQMDMIRQVWGIGNWYMHDKKHASLRDKLVTGLSQKFDLPYQR